ncbi:MAG: sensor histidine kinase [Thermovirgaceae bacterium]
MLKERRGAFLRSFRFRMMFLASLSILLVTVLFSAAVFVFLIRTELDSLDQAQEHLLGFLAARIEEAGQFCLENSEYEELRSIWQSHDAEFQIYSSGWDLCENILPAGSPIDPLDSELARAIVEKGPGASTIDLFAMTVIPDTYWLSPFFPEPARDLLRIRWRRLSLDGGTYYLFALHPLHGLLAFRESLLRMILSLLGLTVLLSTVMGYLTAKKATKPFSLINRAISKVSIENMKLDVSVQDTDEEIRETIIRINRMLENFEKSIRQLQQFTADASHELRTPLAVMKGITEVALLKERESEYYVKKLQELAGHIEGMQTLVGALLELARLDTFDRIEPRESVELLIVADDAVTACEPRSREKGQSLEKDLSPAPTYGREALLLRLATNLLDNAIKYTPEGGTIRIRTWADRARGEAVLEIEDTGMGMTQEEISHCFDRFWRADHARSTTGYGLGLSLVLRIAELHEARPEIESRPGQGTLFRFRFPLDEKSLENYSDLEL